MEQQDSQRDSQGRFTTGNQYARCRKADMLKTAMHEAVSEDDIRDIITMLVTKAKNGDTRAAALLLDRVLGKPHANKEETVSPYAGLLEPVCLDDDEG